jgi:Txe/YoeB family toxin of toxin-antitoxin system
MYKIRWSRRALKDKWYVDRAGLGDKLSKMLGVVERDPYEQTPGHYCEKLAGNLNNAYSRRIDYHNRFIYTVLPNTENAINDKTGKLYDGFVYVHRSWGHP